jgi:hypothetical protein
MLSSHRIVSARREHVVIVSYRPVVNISLSYSIGPTWTYRYRIVSARREHIVIVSYRPDVNMSLSYLHCDMSHLKRRSDLYLKLILSTSYRRRILSSARCQSLLCLRQEVPWGRGGDNCRGFALSSPRSLRFKKVKGKVHPCTGTEVCTGRTVDRGSRGIAVLYRHWGSVQAVRSIGGVEV